MAFYVARPYGKRKNHLWKIASRPMKSELDAQNWQEFMNETAKTKQGNPCPARGSYFVLEADPTKTHP